MDRKESTKEKIIKRLQKITKKKKIRKEKNPYTIYKRASYAIILIYTYNIFTGSREKNFFLNF